MSNPFARSPLARGGGEEEEDLSKALEESITISKPSAKMEKEKEKKEKKSKKSSKKDGKSGPSTIDVIDKMDLSTLYGGLGGFHHEGPFDAASTARNARGARRPAPMAAFTPASLVDPSHGALNPLNHPRPGELAPEFRSNYTPDDAANGAVGDARVGRQSSRRHPTGAAAGSTRAPPPHLTTSDYTLAPPSASIAPGPQSAGPSPLANTTSNLLTVEGPDLRRRASESSIQLGYPHEKSGQKDGKRAAWNEAFGIIEQEAWQDFGRGKTSEQPPVRESVYQGDEGRQEWRANRVASVWDIEATLMAGRPIASAPPVPALPPMPAQYANAASGGDGSEEGATSPQFGAAGGPKRSKSLIQRIRKVRRDPNTPMGEEEEGGFVGAAVAAEAEGSQESGGEGPRAPRRQKSAADVRPSQPGAGTSRSRANTMRNGARPVISGPIAQSEDDDPDARLQAYSSAAGRSAPQPNGSGLLREGTTRRAPPAPAPVALDLQPSTAGDGYFQGRNAYGDEEEEVMESGGESPVLSPGGTTSSKFSARHQGLREELGRKPSLMQKMKGVVVGGGKKTR